MGYYETEENHTRTERPRKLQEESFSVSEVRILVPADPEKLRALAEARKIVTKRRTKAGLTGKRRTSWMN